MSKVTLKRVYNPLWLKIQKVKKFGNGAIVYVDKQFIGKEAIVIIEKGDKDEI